MYTADAKKYFALELKDRYREDKTEASKRIAEALGITKGAITQWGETVPESSAEKLHRLSFNKIPLIASHYEKRQSI